MLRLQLFWLAVFCAVIFSESNLFSQPQRNSYESGIWSKNMELLKPRNWSGKEPVLMHTINSTHCLVLTVGARYQPSRGSSNASQWVSHLLVTNVEDPRSPSTAVTIRGMDSSYVSSGNTHFVSTISFGYVATWTDTLGTSNLQGHTFAIVYVDSPEEERLERVKRTRGWDEAELRRREKLQMPLDKKRVMANDMVRNTAGADDEVRNQVRKVLSRILAGISRS